ncbi:MAG: DUF2807 domain-containing protein, partial [Acidimicrobiia bacterium]|nr:DUF2807 domain-containing protein [Acidimicrobiia bacterium]
MRQQLHRGSLLLLVALLSSMLAGCENGIISIGDEGSGIPVTETREVASFSSIEAGGALNLDVTVDPAALQSVEVVYDDNIIDRLTTEVRGDTLVVDLEGSINLTGNIDRVVTIVMNDLESIDASGA